MILSSLTLRALMSRDTKRWVVHILLFGLTFTTASLIQGSIYAATIMTILLAHELGHYLMCRKYGVETTFPIFIPMPNLFGTLGAVIAMKGRIPSRKALFDIGVSGPLAGLALAIPAILVGLHFSRIGAKPEASHYLQLGEPILFTWLSHFVLGPIPDTKEIFLHPIAFAGWAAFFVTSINLVPAGQLDGGHMIHALVGPRIARWLSFILVIVFALMGLKFHPTWYVFSVLVFLASLRTAKPLDEKEPIDRRRILLAVFTFVLMALCFTPVPIQFTPATP